MHSGPLPGSGLPSGNRLWHRKYLRLLSRCPDHRILGVGQTTCSARPTRRGEGRGAMALSLDAAAEVFREVMRDTVKRYSLWYLILSCPRFLWTTYCSEKL